ncbi:MAG TPA: anti-sigma factor antagonist [Caldithrix sp.]|nr:anti-sigma factor antagonist [Caldithrix sp.]
MEGIQVSNGVAGSQNQISIIKVGGFIDTTTSSEVERALNSLLKQNRYNIIIDLGNVDYISSAGWGIFISEIKSIREHNGDLKLVRMIPDVYEIFELLEFHHILDVYDNVEDAIQKFEMAVAQPQAEAVDRESYSGEPVAVAETASIGSTTPAARPVDRTVSAQPVTSQPTEKTPVQSTFTKEHPLSMASLETKIKHIVAANPNLGAYKINKILNTEKYNFSKVGWFGVRSILSQLGLNTRKNRKKFAQQFAKQNV